MLKEKVIERVQQAITYTRLAINELQEAVEPEEAFGCQSVNSAPYSGIRPTTSEVSSTGTLEDKLSTLRAFDAKLCGFLIDQTPYAYVVMVVHREGERDQATVFIVSREFPRTVVSNADRFILRGERPQGKEGCVSIIDGESDNKARLIVDGSAWKSASKKVAFMAFRTPQEASVWFDAPNSEKIFARASSDSVRP